VYSPQLQRGEGKDTTRERKVMPILKATENETLNFIKKGELKENSIYSFKQIEDTEIETYQIKKNSIGVSESKILIDATIPFQIKPWGYEEMKNPDEKVNIGGHSMMQKSCI